MQVLAALMITLFGLIFVIQDYVEAGTWYWFKKYAENLKTQLGIAILVSGVLFLIYSLIVK
jgi:hypothetical protein